MAQLKAEKKFTLYYFPTSYSSQKVLLAFFEKELAFTPRLVSLFSGQHNQPWYVKLNPEGAHVPVLRDETTDTTVTDPASIMEYVDEASENGERLFPDESSELGKQVRQLCKRLDMIEMDVITYGIIYHPHLSGAGCQISGAVQRSMRENFANRLSYLTELAAAHPALRDSYLTKSQIAAQKFDIITDEAKVKGHLEALKRTLKDIEQQLKELKEKNGDVADELWLFGPMFTAADIHLTVLLNRLALLGMDKEYFSQSLCPHIDSYFSQVKKRPTYVRLEKDISTLKLTLVWENLKAWSPYLAGAAGLGLAAGGAYLIYQKSK
ncbi:ganglioside-induced differentiation-associated protein 1-like [Saccostrea echinata]|uniref:ganglioside-induced differentiation-associated protein 1-like n=1 Tax=Saccostrea echinata TaxID=191078 RepID=UPI002A7F2F97|nr:ganglioside-induced differentiation-associated protein 1-like [Saccostrea echinata]